MLIDVLSIGFVAVAVSCCGLFVSEFALVFYVALSVTLVVCSFFVVPGWISFLVCRLDSLKSVGLEQIPAA